MIDKNVCITTSNTNELTKNVDSQNWYATNDLNNSDKQWFHRKKEEISEKFKDLQMENIDFGNDSNVIDETNNLRNGQYIRLLLYVILTIIVNGIFANFVAKIMFALALFFSFEIQYCSDYGIKKGVLSIYFGVKWCVIYIFLYL